MQLLLHFSHVLALRPSSKSMTSFNLLLSLIPLLSSIFVLAASSKITLPLTATTHHSSSDAIQTLKLMATASLYRAHHLKQTPKYLLTKMPLYPKSYSEYSVTLSFGTPPQSTSFIMDTGSSLIWFPCTLTSRYLCSNCSIDPSKIPTFVPKRSSTSKPIACRNPKCASFFDYGVKSECHNSSQACPGYVQKYGLGSTTGVFLSETLKLPDKTVTDIFVGCSIRSDHQPAGIAGFGRSPYSLPSQMKLRKFSHCLVSHDFDDDPKKSSDLVLYNGSSSGEKEMTYMQFQKNPEAYPDYYYVPLRKITVGKKNVKIPSKYLVPGKDGKGGTITDSGTSYTFLERPLYDAVVGEFEAQMRKYTRARDIEKQTGLRPCFDFSKEDDVDFPELVFKFKGGAKIKQPSKNYFALFTDYGIACLTMITDTSLGQGVTAGPAIIWGNYQQQDFYIEYDLERNKFGFREQTCAK